MSNTYRVDRVTSDKLRAPCGMNSIVTIGDSLAEARKCFFRSTPGIDSWGKVNPAYGVALYQWSAHEQDYLRIGFKDYTGSLYMEVK